ncbi:MAG TPA: nickel-binding protein [Actinomycetota bacterium]
MPLFMDRHDGANETADEVAKAHLADLGVQDRYGVRYITYWFDPDREAIFCLADAPNKEAAEQVHRESHGLLASQIIEVDQDMVQRFLGQIYEPQPGEPIAQTAFRAILFTDMEGSTELTQRLGDVRAMDVLRAHDKVVRSSLRTCEGREVKHTGDGIMASFVSVARALECAAGLQQALDVAGVDMPGVRVGLNAGEPVTENDDLFGAAVQLAARICAAADGGDVLASSAVKELSLGKGFTWGDRGEHRFKGFIEPVRVHELLYRDQA